MSGPVLPQPSLEHAVHERDALEAELKKEKKEKKKKKKDKQTGSRRGIETMFRTTFQTHNDLVALADNKANMMISVNGIIVSILVASLSPQLEETGWVIIPTGLLLVGCIGSLICSVLAARPRVTRSPVSLEEVRAGRANLLFFGNFLDLPEEDYLQCMRILMENPDAIYMTMVRNLYALGHILEKKFRLLWLSYTLFLSGLGLAVLVAVVVLLRWLTTGPVALP